MWNKSGTRIKDSRGSGAPTPEGAGCSLIIWHKFSQKLHELRRVHAFLAPHRSANVKYPHNPRKPPKATSNIPTNKIVVNVSSNSITYLPN